MPKRVFICYRRSDTQMAAGRLRAALIQQFGSDSVFRDKEAIPLGCDWVEEVRRVLGGDVVVLALVGARWADSQDAQGRRRLDDPQDSNRLELETALSKNVRLIPVLVDEANLPGADSLPSNLRPMTRRNAIRLRDDDWDADFYRLTDALRAAGVTPSVGPSEIRGRKVAPITVAWVTAAALLLAALIGAWFWPSSIPSRAAPRDSTAVSHNNGTSNPGDVILGTWDQQEKKGDHLQYLGTFIVSRKNGRYVMSTLSTSGTETAPTIGISDVNCDGSSWTFKSNWGSKGFATFALTRVDENVFDGSASLNGESLDQHWIKRSGQ